mgnify:CR=1 FL=1
MTGDYMLLLILCIPFAGALVTFASFAAGKKGAGESSDGKKEKGYYGPV